MEISRTQLRMEENNYFKIKAIAEEKARSANSQIVYILEQYIKDYEKINGPIDISKYKKTETEEYLKSSSSRKTKIG